ncbi:hypothetical protein PanWU01x14_181650 [Parasponia andersonii]|uniref:Uncharacterized protein n=1 Tax=Parasponia andersonii TaxID=3476 RepID=A0A2P5C5S6_PARAD|nr:hypothetical protein PanWU01x14_181650 [Parasponia andersonii]
MVLLIDELEEGMMQKQTAEENRMHLQHRCFSYPLIILLNSRKLSMSHTALSLYPFLQLKCSLLQKEYIEGGFFIFYLSFLQLLQRKSESSLNYHRKTLLKSIQEQSSHTYRYGLPNEILKLVCLE